MALLLSKQQATDAECFPVPSCRAWGGRSPWEKAQSGFLWFMIFCKKAHCLVGSRDRSQGPAKREAHGYWRAQDARRHALLATDLLDVLTSLTHYFSLSRRATKYLNAETLGNHCVDLSAPHCWAACLSSGLLPTWMHLDYETSVSNTRSCYCFLCNFIDGFWSRIQPWLLLCGLSS